MVGVIIPIVAVGKTKPPRKVVRIHFTGQHTVPGIHSQFWHISPAHRIPLNRCGYFSFRISARHRVVPPEFPIGEIDRGVHSIHQGIGGRVILRGALMVAHRVILPCFPRRPKHIMAHVTPASQCTAIRPDAAGKQAVSFKYSSSLTCGLKTGM